MLNAYEQRLMAFYLANAAAALHHRDREASDLAGWIADRESRAAFGRRKRPSPIRAGTGKRGRDEGLSGGDWRSLRTALREEYSAARKARPDRTGQRLRRLARATGLSRTDVDLLELVLRYQAQPVIESMIDDVFRSSRRFAPLNVQGPALPALLGVSTNSVQARLRVDAPLVRSGLVSVDSDGDLKTLDRLNRLAAAPAGSGSGTDMHRLLLDAALASELEWSDFDHVARSMSALRIGAPKQEIHGAGFDTEELGKRAHRPRRPVPSGAFYRHLHLCARVSPILRRGELRAPDDAPPAPGCKSSHWFRGRHRVRDSRCCLRSCGGSRRRGYRGWRLRYRPRDRCRHRRRQGASGRLSCCGSTRQSCPEHRVRDDAALPFQVDQSVGKTSGMSAMMTKGGAPPQIERLKLLRPAKTNARPKQNERTPP